MEYEEIRQRRLEENKKKMENLNLTHLLHTLRNSPPKLNHVKQGKPRAVRKEEATANARRRSSRLANLPVPVPESKECLLHNVYALNEARLDVVKKAIEVQSNLEPEFPSFVKSVLQSHVNGGMHIPKQFCKLNLLPKDNATITLIDESGDEHQTTYIAHRTCFYAGWRYFLIAHELVDGDALVFQLIEATKFKVYIIRASVSAEVDGALSVQRELLKLA